MRPAGPPTGPEGIYDGNRYVHDSMTSCMSESNNEMQACTHVLGSVSV